jgi:hypothetical protein
MEINNYDPTANLYDIHVIANFREENNPLILVLEIEG